MSERATRHGRGRRADAKFDRQFKRFFLALRKMTEEIKRGTNTYSLTESFLDNRGRPLATPGSPYPEKSFQDSITITKNSGAIENGRVNSSLIP